MTENAEGKPLLGTSFSVAELFAAKLEPEPAEHAYRRGYRDGWIVATNAMHDLMFADRFTRQAAYDRCWDHWEKALYLWVKACRGSEEVWPPCVE